MHRSYLFAPGHNAKLLGKVFDAGADAVMLDLEDAVPPGAKSTARAMVAGALAEREASTRRSARAPAMSRGHARSSRPSSAPGARPGGDFVDVPVAERARRVLELAAA